MSKCLFKCEKNRNDVCMVGFCKKCNPENYCFYRNDCSLCAHKDVCKDCNINVNSFD